VDFCRKDNTGTMINWGIIGCGNVTEVKSGPAFSKVENSRLVAVMRRNAALAEDYARRHNVPRFYSDASELINDPEVSAIYVATPPESHASYAIEAIRAGKPVYIEKPMALNHDGCMMIIDEAARHNVPVFVAYYRRALPGFVKVKEMIEQGLIGDVRFIQLQLFKPVSNDELAGRLPWRVDPGIAGGGHFFDLASHQLDWLDFVFGPVLKVNSVVLNHSGLYKAEDYVTADFVFSGNIVASGTWSFSVCTSCERDSIEIFGSKGLLKFSTFSFEPIVLTNETGTRTFINERPEHVQICLIEKIVQALHGKGESPSTGVSAARTSKVMDEVVKDFYKNR
jgi:predicted dehydrogenase